MTDKMIRRNFLKKSAVLSSAAMFGPAFFSDGKQARGASLAGNPIPYENKLRDHLWMWGHDTGVYDGPGNNYNIPVSENITMAESIKLMGIPNVCVIRWGAPDEKYLEQFKTVKRLAWVVSGNLPNNSYNRLSRFVLPLFDKIPNLTGVYLDDFYRSGAPVKVQTDRGEIEASRSNMTFPELKELDSRLKNRAKPLEMGIVLYSHQLRQKLEPQAEYADFISYWIWSGKDINKMDADFQHYRKIFPRKRTMLGIYMWNFGECKPLDSDLMKYQLDYALDLYEKREIEGLIFHCTPLCNKKIEAVEYAKKWIQDHAEVKPRSK